MDCTILGKNLRLHTSWISKYWISVQIVGEVGGARGILTSDNQKEHGQNLPFDIYVKSSCVFWTFLLCFWDVEHEEFWNFKMHFLSFYVSDECKKNKRGDRSCQVLKGWEEGGARKVFREFQISCCSSCSEKFKETTNKEKTYQKVPTSNLLLQAIFCFYQLESPEGCKKSPAVRN